MTSRAPHALRTGRGGSSGRPAVLSYETAARLLGRGEAVEPVARFDGGRPAGFTAAGGSRAEARDDRFGHASVLHVLRGAGAAAAGRGAESGEEIAAAGGEELETFVRGRREEGLLPRRVAMAPTRASCGKRRAGRAGEGPRSARRRVRRALGTASAVLATTEDDRLRT